MQDGNEQQKDENTQEGTARHAYNRMSRIYGWLSDSSEHEFVERAIDGMLKPQPGDVVLEPGFGTGQVLLALAELVGSEGRVYGIDISDGMVERTKGLLNKHGLLDRAVIARGSATDLPYPDGFFDSVFCSFTLELFPNDQIPVVLSEFARVLKPDGRLCVASMSDEGGSAAMEKLYSWSHDKFPNFVDCRPIDVVGTVSSSGFAVASKESLSMWGLSVMLVLALPPRSSK